MSQTITIRLTKAQAEWLEHLARITGRAQGEIIREQIEKARSTRGARPFMRLSGVKSGPANLSRRKGFSR